MESRRKGLVLIKEISERGRGKMLYWEQGPGGGGTRRVRTHVCQLNLIQRTVFVVDRNSFHGIEGGVHTINDFAEDGVPSVQMGLLAVCYEELGLVRIWTRVGHGHHAAGVKLGSEERTERKKGVRQNHLNR